MGQITKLLSLSNVVANGTASVTIPLGPTYRRFTYHLSGTTFNTTHISEIRLKVNGRIAYQIKGADLIKENAYYGLPANANIITLDLSELYARDQVGQNIGCYPSNVFSQFQMEVDIAAAAVNPVLDVYADWSAGQDLGVDANGRPKGVIEKRLNYTLPATGAGRWTFTPPIGMSGSIIKRIYVYHANVTALEVKKNGVIIHETPVAVNSHIQTENKHSPQAGLMVWDPVVESNLTEMVPTTDAVSFEFNMTTSAADTIRIAVEYIDPIANL